MADTQIVNSDVAAGESPYVLAPSVEVTLKAVNADFTDNGALAAWLPAVLITSDSGHTIALAVDTAVEVAAGGDASVSFFPGVKHAGGGTGTSTLDAFSPQQVVPLFLLADEGWQANWNNFATADSACLYGGFISSDGTQNALLATRFTFGPKGSLWDWRFVFRTGPDHGQIWGYLASIPEDDSASGAADPTGILQSIDTLNYVLAFKIDTYSAVLTRNVIATVGARPPATSYFNTSQLRVTGNPGDPFTTITADPVLIGGVINGGPGPYALQLVAGGKSGASTGYKLELQHWSAARVDWAFG